jgi:hypothetical protein
MAEDATERRNRQPFGDAGVPAFLRKPERKKPVCHWCGGSGIEEVYVGHGSVREYPCGLCEKRAKGWTVE